MISDAFPVFFVDILFLAESEHMRHLASFVSASPFLQNDTMIAYKVHMSDEEKIVDAEVQKKEPEKKLTRKEKKEKKKKEKEEKKKKKKKHSPKFWMAMMILFVAVLALAVFLPDYLAGKKAAPETAAASASPEDTVIPSSSPEASAKVQETAPSVPSQSAFPEETASSGRIYTAGKKETLQMIAENELGDINLWKEILKENPDLGEMDGSTVLKEGQKLHLPQN